jgi:hypothetical protein
MKKLLGIIVLGLLWTGNANATDLCFQKLNDYQVKIYKYGFGYANKCNGYVVDSKTDKKFYKYFKSWIGIIGRASREEVLKVNMFRLSANNPDPKFQKFVKSVLGYNFKNHPVRKSTDKQILSFSQMGGMNIDTQIAKKTPEPLPRTITAYVGITQLTHATKVKAQSREDALYAGILHCRKLYKKYANDCFVLKLFADNKLSETHDRSPSLIKFNREVKKIKTFDLQYKISDKALIASLHFERRRIIANNPKIASPKVSNKTSVKTQVASKKIEKKNTNQLKEIFKKKEKKPDKQVAKQKEFTLEEKDLDKDPPIITIAESITVNNADYEIKGEVKDKSKKIFVLVDGQPVDVKRGKFKIKRFSPIDEKVEIVAIDKWNNRSKKTVNVKVDIKSIDVAEQLEKLDPRKIKGKRNSNAVALIIGVEKYTNAPDANFANLDAKFFAEYAKKAFGVKSSNLKLLIDQDASLVKTISTLSKWLPTKMMEEETDLIIFFAGHGLASPNGEKLYLLAQDSDTELLDRTALSRDELFKEILKYKPKSVTMFLDTCYSGVSRDEKTLLASARPIRISVKETNEVPENFTIFSASQLDQISSSIKEAKHGIFSYYLMKGLEGKADLNKDRSLTNKELLTFMKSKVNAKAVELGRQQIPVLTGNPEKIILTY